MEMKNEEFNKILACAINDGMKRILGETATQAIYFYIEHDEHLKLEGIPNNLNAFLFTLERIFNVGALVIEKAIMENLYSRLSLKNKNLRLKYKNKEQFNLINYVNDIRAQFCISSSQEENAVQLEGEIPPECSCSVDRVLLDKIVQQEKRLAA
jgi:hypothetical protein